ncbi:MAG: RNA polymerase subunit sigma-24, partial [Chloroflexota bacterium]
EMADEMDTPKGTVKWRLHQARKRLRGLLSGRARNRTEVING